MELPHTPSRISSKSFSKIQESPASTGSSLLAGSKHDPGDKVDDGRSRLVRVQLCKEVADVVRGAPLLPGHEAEELGWATAVSFSPLSFLGVQITEGDSIERIVSSEEQFPLVVC